MANIRLVVANSARARLFSIRSRREIVEERDLLNPQVRLHEQELTSDLPGRSFDIVGEGRHAMESKTSPKRAARIAFAKQLAAELEQERQRGEFDRLLVFSGPGFLGLLRDELSDALTRLLVAAVDKDFTALPPEQLLEHIPAGAFPPPV